MSSQRGNTSKRGPQKYQNKTAFRNNLHDASDKTKILNQLAIEGCCRRCKEILEWKIKFKKYKMLSQPKKCIKCLQKRVTNSYYTVCMTCSEQNMSCGKCGEPIKADERPEKIRTEIGANNATNNSLPNEEESPDLPDDEASSIDDYLSDSDEPYS